MTNLEHGDILFMNGFILAVNTFHHLEYACSQDKHRTQVLFDLIVCVESKTT